MESPKEECMKSWIRNTAVAVMVLGVLSVTVSAIACGLPKASAPVDGSAVEAPVE